MLRSNHSRRRSLHLLAAPLRFRRPFPSGSGAAYSASAAAQDRSSRKTFVYLLSMVGAMVGASYAAVLCPTVRRNTHRRRHHRAPPLSSPHRIAAVTHHSVALLRRAIAISVAAPRRRHLRRRAVPCRTIAVVVARCTMSSPSPLSCHTVVVAAPCLAAPSQSLSPCLIVVVA